MKRIPSLSKWCLSLMLTLSFVVTTGFVFPSATTVSKPAKSENCPNVADLVNPGEDAQSEIRAVLPKLIQETYGQDPRYKVYEIKRIISLKHPESSPYSGIARQQCGKAVAKRSWLVELFFPEFLPSASLSQGQIFVAKTKDKGWVVWFRYH